MVALVNYVHVKYSKNKRKDENIDNSFKNIHVGSQYVSLFYTK